MNKKYTVLLFLLIIGSSFIGNNLLGQVTEKVDKALQKELVNAFSDKGAILKGAQFKISSLDAKYCSASSSDILTHESWDADAITIEWTIRTNYGSEGLVDHPSWGEITGTGSNTTLTFYPDRVDPKYYGARIFFNYSQKDITGFVVESVTDYTNVYQTATIYNFGSDQSICTGDASPVLILENSEDDFSYQLKRGISDYGIPVDGSSGSALNFTVSDAGTYTVIATNATEISCVSVMNGSPVITINPLPTVDATSNTPVCEGAALTLTGVTSGNQYSWTSTTGFTSTELSPSVSTSATTAMSGTYTLSVEDVNGCKNSDNTTVVVNSLPVISADNQTICNGQTATLSVNNPVAGVTYHWSTGATGISINVNPSSTTVYTVYAKLVAAPFCESAPINVTVTVNPFPDPAGTITGSPVVCQNQAGVSYTVPVIANTLTYSWSYSGTGATINGTGNAVTVDFAAGATSGNLTVQGVNGCGNGTVSANYSVTANPRPTASISGTASVCLNGPAQTVTLTGANGTAPYTFSYNINGGATLTVVSVGNNATVSIPTGTAGVFVVNLLGVSDSSPTSCANTASGSATVTVNALPTASIAGGTLVCRNAASPNVTFTGANGSAPYTFTYTINGGANQSISTAVGNNSVSLPVPTAAAGPFVYALVSVSDANSCSNTASGSTTFTVQDLPIGTVSGTTSVCLNAASQLVTFTGSNATLPYTFTYNINGGASQTVTTTGGSSTATVTVPTTTAGSFTYNLTGITEGSGATCPGSVSGSATVTVQALPTASISGGGAVCKDDASPVVTFTGNGGTTPYTFEYRINGGALLSISTLPGNSSVDINAPTSTVGTFTYTLVSVNEGSVNDCSNSASGNAVVTVNAFPDAAGAISGAVDICEGQTGVSYTVPAIANALTYSWNYSGTGATINGTGNSVTVDFAAGATSGNLTVQGVNGCGNGTVSANYSVTVHQLPTASISGTATACVGDGPQVVTFTGANGTAPYTFTYNINGGAPQTVVSTGNTGTINIPTTSAGVFAANLVGVSDDSPTKCSNAASGTATVTVHQVSVSLSVNPPANPTNTKVCVGETVTFQANASGGMGIYTNYVFDIRSYPAGSYPATPAQNAATNIYTIPNNLAAGFYQVRVTAYDQSGCSAIVESSSFEVIALPVITLTTPKSEECFGEAVSFTALPTGYSKYTFNVDGNTIDNGANNVYTTSALAVGPHDVYVTATNGGGCAASSNPYVNITINPLPTVAMSTDKEGQSNTVCENELVTFTASGATTYEFSVDGNTYTTNPFTYSSANDFTVNLVGFSNKGCRSSNQPSTAITISKPLATLLPLNPTICAGDAISFTATGGVSYTFEINNANPVTQASGTFVPSVALTNGDVISVVATNNLGCTSPEVSTTVTVNPVPVVTLSSNDADNTICAGDNVTFTATSDLLGAMFEFFVDDISVVTNATGVYSTMLLTNGGRVYADVTVNGCTKRTATITTTVNSLPGVTLSAPKTIACIGENIEFTATGATTYEFFVIVNGVEVSQGPASANNKFTYASNDDYSVVVKGYSSASCPGLSNVVDVVISKPVATVTAPFTTICQDNEVIFTATGGVTYSFYLNGNMVQGPGALDTYTTSSLANGDRVSAIAVNEFNCTSPMSNDVVMTVNNNPDANIVSDKVGNAVCINSPILFTASSLIGDEYEFFVNNTSVQPRSADNTFESSALVNGDDVHVVVYVNATGCSKASSSIDVTVNDLPNVAITAIPGLNIIQNTNVDFTATLHAGATYQWYVNNTAVTGSGNLYSSSTLADNDSVNVVITDVNGCVNTAFVRMRVFDSVQPLNIVVTPAGYCTTSATGVNFTIANPQAGVIYELYREAGVVSLGIGTLAGAQIEWSNIRNIAVGAENYYVIGYHPSVPTERVEMANRPVVTEYALPIVQNVTPTGTVTDCNNGAGYVISLDNSQSGVLYRLLRDGYQHGDSIVADGVTPVVFPATVTEGTYTVRAKLVGVDACEIDMNGSYTIDLSHLGPKFTLSSNKGGSYCENGSGVTISQNGSQNGLQYVLRNGNEDMATVTGTGSPIVFGTFTAVGTYTAVVRDGGCERAMQNPVTVTMIPLPLPTDVLVGNKGFFCDGSAGVEIKLAGQQNGIKYYLMLGGNIVANATGAADNAALELSFGTFNTPGVYDVMAVSGTNCSIGMNNSVELTVEDVPQQVVFNSSASAYCQGSNVALTIENSVAGTDYYLLLDGLKTGDFVSGNDGARSFSVSQPGTYKLRAVKHNTNTQCEVDLDASLVITETAMPEQRNVVLASAGTSCDNGAVIRVEASQSDIVYRLYRNNAATSLTLTGNGSDIDFTNIVDKNGNYTVMATANPGSCEVLMASPAINVAIGNVPDLFVVTINPTGNLCRNDLSGYSIGLDSSEVGFDYTLYNESVNIDTIPGNGSALDFGLFTQEGTYGVRATNVLEPSCSVDMLNQVVVAYNELPIATLVSDRGTTIISGTAVTFTAGGGINYEFQINNLVVQSLSPVYTYGAVSSLKDGDVVTAIVTDANGCVDTAQIVMQVLPAIADLPIDADRDGYCTNEADGVTVIVPNAQAGVTYELVRQDGTNFGPKTLVVGTSEVSWSSVKNSGIGSELFHVEAYYDILPAERFVLTSTVTITEYALPVAFDVIPNTTVSDCNNGDGYTIQLSGSESGVVYYHYLNGFKTGEFIQGDGMAGAFNAFYNVKDIGIHTVRASVAAVNGCQTDMQGAFTIAVDNLPVAFNLVGDRADGHFCQGSQGVTISLDGTEAGVTYYLRRGSVSVDTIIGDGNQAVFGQFIAEGTYMAYADTAGCTAPMNGNITLTAVESPKTFGLLAENNGDYCADDADGVLIELEGQQTGYIYELYRNGVAIDTLISTYTSELTHLSFGQHTEAGTYIVYATVPDLGCSIAMDTVDVTIKDLPADYVFTTDNSVVCEGGSTILYIPNSAISTSYQLLKDGGYYGIPIMGTGSRINFMVNQLGTYKVLASLMHQNVSCSKLMADSSAIVVTGSSLPLSKEIVIKPGTDCENGTIVKVVNPEIDIKYFIYSRTTGLQLPGYEAVVVGDTAFFAPLVDSEGDYFVVGENAAGCQTHMPTDPWYFSVDLTNAVKKQVVSVPDNICLGDNGVVIRLEGSDSDVKYSLIALADTTVIQTTMGTGGAINFDRVFDEGLYTVFGENTSDPRCPNEMLNQVTIKYNPLPKAFKLTGSGFYCDATKGATIGIDDSEFEVTYTLMYHANDGIKFVDSIPGLYDGGEISFNSVVTEGEYTVYARTSLGCTSSMNNKVTVESKGMPLAVPVVADNTQHCGNEEATITLNGIETGVTYSLVDTISQTILENKVAIAGQTQIIFSVADGGYHVDASWGGDACERRLTDSAIVVTSAPVPDTTSIKADFNVVCDGVDNYISVVNPTNNAIYTLVVDDVVLTDSAKTYATGNTLRWLFKGTAGKINIVDVKAYFAGHESCAIKANKPIVIDTKAKPAAFVSRIKDGTNPYCPDTDGATLVLENVKANVTYSVYRNGSTNRYGVFIPSVDSASVEVATLSSGFYLVVATQDNSACATLTDTLFVKAVNAPTKEPVVNAPAMVCRGSEVSVTVGNVEANVTYQLRLNGNLYGESILATADDSNITWTLASSDVVGNPITVVAAIGSVSDASGCGLLTSKAVSVNVKPSPAAYNVTPIDSSYCEGEPGLKVSLSGSEANVFYELAEVVTIDVDNITYKRKDYFMPSDDKVGLPFTFRDFQPEGSYVVMARYLDGDCTVMMNGGSNIYVDELSGKCTPLVANADYLNMANKDVVIKDSVFVNNDLWNSNLDSLGVNLQFEALTNYSYNDGNITVPFETVGEVKIDKMGVLTYTKIPGFYGIDHVVYRVTNTTYPTRTDTAVVTILVGNHDVEEGSLLIPNAISPNGDGYNDVFVISGMIEDKLVDITDDKVKSNLVVFNRWGTKVYYSKNEKYLNDWDGKGNGAMVSIGKELPNGTYFYVFNITYNLDSGKTVNKTYNGFVEIRR